MVRRYLTIVSFAIVALAAPASVRNVAAAQTDEDVAVFSGSGVFNGMGLVGPATPISYQFDTLAPTSTCLELSEDTSLETGTCALSSALGSYTSVICGTGIGTATLSVSGVDPLLSQTYTFVVVDWIAIIAGGINGGFPQANGVAVITPVPSPTPCSGGPTDFQISGTILVDLSAAA